MGQRGNALILSVMFVSVVTITSMAILELTVVYNNQMTLTSNWVRERIILESVADYFVLAMKQRWCVDANLDAQPAGEGTCTFTSDYNIERLVTDDDFIAALAEAGRTYGLALPLLIRIPSLDYDLAVSSLSPTNPLSRLFQQPGMHVFDRIMVNISRMDNRSEATSGQESYLKIRITLRAAQNLTVFRNTPQIFLERRLAVFRRDLAYFSLVVPRNLILDGSSVSTGDISFARGAAGAGIRFDSPVFVNQDVLLPGSGSSNTTVFSDAIVQGNGIVRKDGSPYLPTSLGGLSDRYWFQNLQADGILGGISADGVRDQGLDVLVGNVGTPPSTNTAARECITLARAMSDLNLTKDSQLLIRQLPPPAPAGANQNVLLFDFGFTSTRFPGMGLTTPLTPDPDEEDDWMNGYASPTDIWPNLFNLRHQRAGWWNPSGTMPTSGSAAVRMYRVEDGSSPLDDFNRPVFQLAVTARGVNGTAQYFGMATVGTEIQFFPRGTSAAGQQVRVRVVTNYPDYQTAQPTMLSTVQLRVTSISPPGAGVVNNQFSEVDIQVMGLDHGFFAGQDRRTPGFDMFVSNVLTDPVPVPQLDEISTDDYEIPPAAFIPSPPTPGRDQGETRVPGRTPFARLRLTRAADSPIFTTTVGNDWSIQDADMRLPPTTYPGQPAPLNSGTIPAWALPAGPGEPGYIDYANRYLNCSIFTTQKASAFAIGGPDQSYLESTRSSWNYNNHDPNIDGVNPPAYGALPATSNATIDSTNQDEFHNLALYNVCTVAASAERAVGFFVCDTFNIAGPRTTPLTIIGTVITGRLNIDSSAYSRGVNFRTVYHPQSVIDMRSWGNPPILSLLREPREPCSFYPPYPANGQAWPVWHPALSVTNQGDHLTCNSIFYQRNVDNFRWTQVDPDCGFQADDPANHRCKRRPYKFLIKMIGDQYLLK